jgi:hypothetical protein
LTITAWSQNQKIDQARVNFISQKLQLSQVESQKFWPVYNEYLDKIKSIRHQRKKMFQEFDYSQNRADADQFIKTFNQLELAEYQIKSEYSQKFKQIIGVVKTAHLFKAEEEFRLELVKILKSD